MSRMSKFVMDEPDKQGFREIREVDKNGEEGIIGWIQIDNHDEKQLFENIILDSLNSVFKVRRLNE